MDDWTIKSSDSEDFRRIVIPYLSHRFGKKLVRLANWYSVIDGGLVMSAERPTFVNILGLDEFIRSIMERREFKKGEKIMISGLKGDYEYIKSTPKRVNSPRLHKFKYDSETSWASEFNVFQKPQKAKKKKKKKKFKNGEKVVIYKGRTDEAVACYIGKNPVERKGIHIVLIDGELGTNNVHESFMKKIK